MNLKKSVLFAGAVGVIGLSTVGATALASSTGKGNSLVDKIAKQFNLKTEDVQKVFDQDKVDHRAKMEQKYENRLTQAVKDGKLTEDQKTKILAKHKELTARLEAQREANKDKRDEFASMTDTERQKAIEVRKAAMDKLKSEISAWEKDNNIPSGYLMLGGMRQGGPGGHHGPGGMMR